MQVLIIILLGLFGLAVRTFVGTSEKCDVENRTRHTVSILAVTVTLTPLLVIGVTSLWI